MKRVKKKSSKLTVITNRALSAPDRTIDFG